MDKQKIVDAWNVVFAAARSAQGNADVHDKIREALNVVAETLKSLVEKESPKAE